MGFNFQGCVKVTTEKTTKYFRRIKRNDEKRSSKCDSGNNAISTKGTGLRYGHVPSNMWYTYCNY